MAVVQISRIQQRRGRKNDGLPQLASGELAWCIDTQELYIGNGSVAEGAPTVGNTKLLTEFDNILSLIGTYEFGKNESIQTGAEINYPVARTIQQRLDDSVSVAAFGVLDDNNLNQSEEYRTSALQRAIDQLYLSASRKGQANARIELLIAPGEYSIIDTIYLPSFVTLKGAGKNKTIFNFMGSGPIFETVDDNSNVGVYYTLDRVICEVVETLATHNQILVNDTSNISVDDPVVFRGTSFGGITVGTTYYVRTIGDDYITISTSTVSGAQPILTLTNDTGFMRAVITVGGNSTNSTNQPQNIKVQDLSVTTESNTTQGIVLNAVRDSVFKNVGIFGLWKAADNFLTTPNSRALELNSVSSVVTTERNEFSNVEIAGFAYGVWSEKDAQWNKFDNLYVHGVGTSLSVHQAVALGIGATSGRGPKYNTISNSLFELVIRHAVYIEEGRGNSSIGNKFVNVGNNGAGNSQAEWPIIYFASPGNSSHNDLFDRVDDLEVAGTTPYVPNINGVVAFESSSVEQINLEYTTTPPAVTTAIAIRLPMPNLNSSVPTARDNIGYEINYVYKRNNSTVSRFGKLLINADAANNTVQIVDEYEYVGPAGQDVKLYFTARIWDTNGDTFRDTLQIFYNLASSVDEGTFSYSYRSIF